MSTSRDLRYVLRTTVLLSSLALASTGCGVLPSYSGGQEPPPDPCVQTHESGCVLEAEFEALVDSAAARYEEQSGFENQWGLEAIGADRAYAHLELQLGPGTAPGEGITAGILDTGIDGAHPSFRNKNVIERFFPGANDEVGDEFSHGTAVASILAGRDIPGFEHDAPGVAWGADLAVFAIPLGEAPELYDPIKVEELAETGEYFAEIISDIVDWRFGSTRIDFLNLSLGVSGIIENYSEEVIREHFAPLLPVLLQEGSNEKVVFVWAGGNAHGTTCDLPISQCVDGQVEASSVTLLPGLAVRAPALKETLVAVVAIRSDGKIADFSNRCGLAADYCLAAPGEGVRVSYFGPGLDGAPVRAAANISGTSAATPMVTGGLVLMKQYFRSQLSNTDLLARLLETADRTGIYADSTIYGRGLMDLAAATSPVGEPKVSQGSHVSGSGAAIGETGLQLGPAFGDALVPALGQREFAAFDALGAPFWYRLGGVSARAPGPPLSERLREFLQTSPSNRRGSPATALRIPVLALSGAPGVAQPTLHLSKFGASAAARANHLSVGTRSLVATLPVTANLTADTFTTEGLAGQVPASGAVLNWRQSHTGIGFRAGWLGERRTVLGTVSSGGFGELEGDTMFAGIEGEVELRGWHVGGKAEFGTVRGRAHDSLFNGISPLMTSAFALHAVRRSQDGGVFLAQLSQPLRIENGHAQLSLPSGRTIAGKVIRDQVRVNLEPGGRQIDLALQYQKPVGAGEIRLGATLSHEPGHRAGAKAEVILLSGWRLSF